MNGIYTKLPTQFLYRSSLETEKMEKRGLYLRNMGVLHSRSEGRPAHVLFGQEQLIRERSKLIFIN
ncbi:hypothetical protein A6V36_05505 [Paraburkholderia ginsengiterrae]|uniref:Uncharacterized protein n=1 Tax=Paraburkholderia ginsengiterrae TaxID=1462993 RepID=A0A1A9NGP5_9BURK|nr:hypothetical protein A6V36_05505 [Paraburkholderia ginsengiterrae]OAJ65600.1 hypothetical protein A6V37_13525 [Paraburkholderia ginsengiterrae]